MRLCNATDWDTDDVTLPNRQISHEEINQIWKAWESHMPLSW